MDVYDSVGGALYALDNAPYRGALRLFAGRSCMYTTYRYGCVWQRTDMDVKRRDEKGRKGKRKGRKGKGRED